MCDREADHNCLSIDWCYLAINVMIVHVHVCVPQLSFAFSALDHLCMHTHIHTHTTASGCLTLRTTTEEVTMLEASTTTRGPSSLSNGQINTLVVIRIITVSRSSSTCAKTSLGTGLAQSKTVNTLINKQIIYLGGCFLLNLNNTV